MDRAPGSEREVVDRRKLLLRAVAALVALAVCIGCGPRLLRVSFPALQVSASPPAPPPPPPPPKVTEQIHIKDRIEFVTDSAKLQKVSYKVLDQVVAVLKANADIKLVEVQGHTDGTGSEEHNNELSQARAESVRAYLIKAGIVAERLQAKGFGMQKPLADNNSDDGKRQNRRVEFHILERAPKDAGK